MFSVAGHHKNGFSLKKSSLGQLYSTKQSPISPLDVTETEFRVS